ncbi:MAG: rhomboid family intramembrane serine protease [Marivibrio sp.]|uniref:rhomboid family intramembrane serine protease n=1 Tax=Marivibrio sp. TaxID=2039719 RepID=UPI0032EB88F3
MSDPQGGKQPILNAPGVVRWLLTITLGAHILRMVSGDGLLIPQNVAGEIFFTLAFIPARYVVQVDPSGDLLAAIVSPVGHTLVHGNWIHLLTNLGFLLAFGTPVARRMGPVVFLIFYGLCAAAGAFLFTALSPTQITPLVGASGAIFGLLGAILRVALYPPEGAPPAPFPFNNRRTAFMFAGVYLAINLLMGIAPALFGVDAAIAWEAHLGGFAAGFLLAPFVDGRGRVR